MKVQQQVDVYELRTNHATVYWNLVWFFSQIQLPFEFLVPYDEVYAAALK